MDEAKRKAIEKAVVDNNGELPSWVAAIRSDDHTIMRDEFEQVKAGMQNKPSWDDAPEWAKWLMQSADGRWEWQSDIPVATSNGWDIADSTHQWKYANETGKVIGDWRNTLEKRPQKNEQPMKYQYGVEYECDGVKPDLDDDVKIICYSKDINKWMLHRGYTDTVGSIKRWDGENGGYHITKFCIVDERYKPKPNLDELSAKEPTPELRGLMRGDWHERGELPPVGERCILHTFGFTTMNKEVVITYRGDEVGCYKVIDTDKEYTFADSDVVFRPLRTERDELVDELQKIIDHAEMSKVTPLAELIVGQGWRPPKN